MATTAIRNQSKPVAIEWHHGTTAFHGHQKITLSNGLEMLIRITGR